MDNYSFSSSGGGVELSFVVPCYNESMNLDSFYLEILNQINTINIQNSKQISCEFIFINDGSTDNTLEILDNLALKDNRVRILNFSRNFGKEAAILAGLQNSSAKATILILLADTFFAFKYILELEHKR
ncbi:glycosyltransferase [Campylobacter lanienae]|uniref:glycosyltransferase n=1 Tax=Campylobacter lanienae TaxID=75658 RepID=UPI00191C777F|nr:glycosyltransferase [Campylobacter lanienae]